MKSSNALPETLAETVLPKTVVSMCQSSFVAYWRMKETKASRMIRSAIAITSPSLIAFSRSTPGSLLARMVMMIRLSAPSAIWISVTENSAA